MAFVCNAAACGKSFLTQQGVINHNREHFTPAEKPFVCPHAACTSRYIRQSGLDFHCGTVHPGDKSNWFKCPEASCQESFFEERALKLHQRVHEIYRCTARNCRNSYNSQAELDSHRVLNHKVKNLYIDRHPKKVLPKKRKAGEEEEEDHDNNNDDDDDVGELFVEDKKHREIPERKIAKAGSKHKKYTKKIGQDNNGAVATSFAQHDNRQSNQAQHAGSQSGDVNSSADNFTRTYKRNTLNARQAPTSDPAIALARNTEVNRQQSVASQRLDPTDPYGFSLGGIDYVAREVARQEQQQRIEGARYSSTDRQPRSQRTKTGVPSTSPPSNNSHTDTTAPAMTHQIDRRSNGARPALGRSLDARRLNPSLARSNLAANPPASSAMNSSFRGALAEEKAKSAQSSKAKAAESSKAKARAPSSSIASAPLDSDSDSDEEGLFVSPPDGNRTQAVGTGSNARVLGVRGFANMALPRDQDSDEEDLRPIHVLMQERLAAAGRPQKRRINPRNPWGYRYATESSERTTLGDGSMSSADPNDKPEETEEVGESMGGSDVADETWENLNEDERESSDDSYGGTPRPGPRSGPCGPCGPRPRVTKPRRSSANNTGPPRTPSPRTPYHPYEVYGPDLESPPPSYLIKSPGVIDRRLPYVDRKDGEFLTDVAAVQPEDLFDADDVFFCFKGPTDHEIAVQKRLDAEKESMKASAYGSGYRAPMHYDTCPYTAPINSSERNAWIAERLRLDESIRRGDGFEDGAGMDGDGHDQTAAAGMSAFPLKGKRPTCAGPVRMKRKYTWKDQHMKNKRYKGGVTVSSRAGPTTRRASREGPTQVDGGGDERVESVAVTSGADSIRRGLATGGNAGNAVASGLAARASASPRVSFSAGVSAGVPAPIFDGASTGAAVTGTIAADETNVGSDGNGEVPTVVDAPAHNNNNNTRTFARRSSF